MKNFESAEDTKDGLFREHHRVVVYHRFQNDSDDSTSSIYLLKRKKVEFIQKYTQWDLIGIYVDYGLKSDSAWKKLLEDAEKGRFDLLLVNDVVSINMDITKAHEEIKKLSNMQPPISVYSKVI